MKKIYLFLCWFFVHNLFKTIWFNFRVLPFSQAIYLPFDLYYKVRIEKLSGKIILNCKSLKRALIKIGGQGSDMFPRMDTVVHVEGVVMLNGCADIGHGSLIWVNKSGVLNIGEHVSLGARSKIFCTKSISIEDCVEISWECQIFDTNFHCMENMNTHKIINPSGEVKIGKNTWICNNVTVGKGTTLPNFITVASHSLCLDDYANLHPYTIIGGYPAKPLKSGMRRVFERFEKVRTVME